MKIAMISPIAWRTPPKHYGPWENVVSLLTEGLIKKGIDVTLFATGDSVTSAKLNHVIKTGYEEDKNVDAKVAECLHISNVFENASQFDLIHNNFDFLPLTYSGLVKTPMVTTIHGFSSPAIYPVYEKYNKKTNYVSISMSDRYEKLEYVDTIYHGIDLKQFTFNENPDDYLIFFGRIHHDKGASEAIEIAKKAGRKLIIAGIIQDREYYEKEVKPHIDGKNVSYVGSVGPIERDNLLRHAFALLHPIHFKEPFGLSVVESMACGTPVIAFNKGSMQELIEHGRNGILVQNVQEAIDMVEQVNGIERSYCRKTVEDKFSSQIMVENYIRAYQKILRII